MAKVALLLFGIATFSTNNSLVHGYAIKLTTNTSAIELGQGFLATCQVEGFKAIATDAFEVDFARDWYERLFKYQISNATTGEPRNTSLTANPRNYTNLKILSHSFNLTTYQVEIVPKETGSHSYKCSLFWPANNIEFFSGGKEISVKPKTPPNAIFTVNVTKVELETQFTANCKISHFEDERKSDYSVQFWRSSGLLATFTVKAPTTVNGKPTIHFTETKHLDISVYSSVHSAFPLFELFIKPHSPVRQNYWCTLVVESPTKPPASHSYKSHLWPNEPLLTLSANVSQHTVGKAFNVRCAISDNFQPTGKTYSVEFEETQLGPLAVYKFKGNEPEDFILEGSHHNLMVAHGVGIHFPNFDILLTAKLSQQLSLRCQLKVDGQLYNSTILSV